MYKTFQKNITVIRVATILVILFSLTATSCSGRKEKGIKTHLIPEKDFIAILTDIHMADGLLIIPKIRNWYSDRDSIQNYLDIIQSHGYTRVDMDRTIRYYFIKKPKQLIKIYDKVLGKLSEMESLVDQELPANRIPVKNLWEGDSAYCLPSRHGNDSLQFDQQLELSGYYTLRFTLTLYPDDPSLKPHFNAYFCQP